MSEIDLDGFRTDSMPARHERGVKQGCRVTSPFLFDFPLLMISLTWAMFHPHLVLLLTCVGVVAQ